MQPKVKPPAGTGESGMIPGVAKPELADKGAETPRDLEKETPKTPEKPQGLMKPQGLEKPLVPAMSASPKPQVIEKPKGPPAAAERKPEPQGKERECGKPGLPACPK